MDPRTAFVRADQALDRVVQQIRDDQWDMLMPDEFAMSAPKDDTTTLRSVIAYHAYDEAWMPDMLAGRTVQEAGQETFDGDLLGADPKAAFAEITAKGIAAAEQLDDLDRVVHFSYGDFPAREALWHNVSFRGLRAIDIAHVLEVDDTLDPELVQGMYDAFLPEVELWRSMGVFGPEVQVPEDAPMQDRLLGLTGRPPRRT